MKTKENNLTLSKPLIYLDQNIYDKIRRGVLGELKETIKELFTVVYSDETLNEINGNENLRDVYLDILEYFDPIYMKLVLTEKFGVTDQAQFYRGPIRVFFEQLKANQSELPDVSKSMKMMANKFIGGLKGVRFDELIDGERQAFEKIMTTLIEKSKDEEKLQPLILTTVNQMKNSFDLVTRKMQKTLNEQIKDQENFRGIKEFRDKVKIWPKQLKNISPPNVMKKIWNELSNSPELKGKGITFNKFFYLESNPIYPGEDYTLYSKVNMLYNGLNSIGYYQDKDIEKPNRFSGSLCDANHVSNAIFCKFFMTGDNDLFRKCLAIYEYFEIGTRIIYVNERSK